MYSRSFLVQTFIGVHTDTFSRGSSESTLDERYLLFLYMNIPYTVDQYVRNG